VNPISFRYGKTFEYNGLSSSEEEWHPPYESDGFHEIGKPVRIGWIYKAALFDSSGVL